MDFKLAEKVKYKGGMVIFGLKEGSTTELLEIQMQPLAETYIWKKITSPAGLVVYIIQHNKGVGVDFFEHNHQAFGTSDFNSLNKTLKYIYVSEHDLESLEPVITPEKEEESLALSEAEELVYEKIKTPLDEDEFEVDVQFKKNEQEEKQELSLESNHPHFTAETCPTNMMVQLIPKQKTLYYRKIAEPFTVTLVSGQIIKGRGGDYLIKNQYNNVFIEPKETFDFMYQEKNNVSTKKLGKEQIEYHIEQDVVDYITFLEKENEKYRIEKYLKK